LNERALQKDRKEYLVIYWVAVSVVLMLMEKIKSFLKDILLLPLYLFSLVVPKDKRIWVFGAWNGDKYGDNPKHLFEYIFKKGLPVNVFWLKRNRHVYLSLKEQAYPVAMSNSFAGIWLCLRAGAAIVSHGVCSDIAFLANNAGTRLIQLWHGMPLKLQVIQKEKSKGAQNLRWRQSAASLIRKMKRAFLFYKKDLKYDLMIAISDEHAHFLNELSLFEPKAVSVTGIPVMIFYWK